MSGPIVGSLCTGYGGLDLAVHDLLGGRTAWTAENDKNTSRVTDIRFPGVPNLGDIKAVEWSMVEPIDVLTAGYPCQPFSAAGLRQGHDDPRHLWPAVRDAIRYLRPGIVVLENVRGHLSLGFPQVLQDLAAIGFDAEWLLLRASDVGACHQRARLFVVATDTQGERRDEGRRSGAVEGLDVSEWETFELGGRRNPLLPDPDSGRWGGGREEGPAGEDEGRGQAGLGWLAGAGADVADPDGGGLQRAAGRPRGQGGSQAWRAAVAGRGEAAADPLGESAQRRGGHRAVAGTARPARHQGGSDPLGHPVGHRRAADPDADRDRQPGRAEPDHTEEQPRLQTPRRGDPGGLDAAASDASGAGLEGRDHADLGGAADPLTGRGGSVGSAERAAVDWGVYEGAIRRHERVLGRAAPSPVNEHGRLSPLFTEWMMMLPAGWVTDILEKRTHSLKALGNGVVPLQARAALEHLLAL